jgi:hypothetical protein
VAQRCFAYSEHLDRRVEAVDLLARQRDERHSSHEGLERAPPHSPDRCHSKGLRAVRYFGPGAGSGRATVLR